MLGAVPCPREGRAMRITRMMIVLSVLGALAAPTPAVAITFCVDDAMELEDALQSAGFSPSDDIIRLEAGVYQTDWPGGFSYAAVAGTGGGDLDISGGWNTTCAFRMVGQRSTIDGELQRPGLSIKASYLQSSLVRVRYLQFVRGVASVERQAGGLTIDDAGDIEIDSNRFSDNASTHPTNGAGGALNASARSLVSVRNNVFVSNDSDTTAALAAGAAYLACGEILPGAAMHVLNNTIVGNTAGSGAMTDTGGIRLDGGCPPEIANNIVWGNDGIDVELNSEDATLRNNDIAELGGTEDPSTNTGNLSIDPQFTSATSVRLKRTSPLIDAGLNTLDGGLVPVSFDGGPRLVGPRVDMGAYELDVLFTASFDPAFGPTGDIE
jgi:hypothetical protein